MLKRITGLLDCWAMKSIRLPEYQMERIRNKRIRKNI